MTGSRRGAAALRPAVLLAVASIAGVTAACSTTPRHAVHVVEMRGLQFQPQRVEVALGDTVVWVNHDIVPHTSTALDHAWASGLIASDSSWRAVVTQPGVHRYFCTLHTNMRAEIDAHASRG